MKMMLTSLTLLIGLAAWGQSEEQVERKKEAKPVKTFSIEKKQTPVQQDKVYKDVVGIVHYNAASENCPLYIDAKVEGQNVRYFPMGLPEGLTKNGLHIKFDYVNATHVRLRGDCGFEKAVTVSNVRMLNSLTPEKSGQKKSNM